jgi:hypothetical protein
MHHTHSSFQTRQPLLTAWRHTPVLVTLIAAASSLLSATPILAQVESPNARVLGSHRVLEQLVQRAAATQCDQPLCSLPTGPITFTIRTPTSPHTRITLTSAKLAAPVSESSKLQATSEAPRAQGPILLRGWTTVDPATGIKNPVAAFISRSTQNPTLSITAPLGSRRTRTRYRGESASLVSLSVALSELPRTNRRNARAPRLSRFAFSGLICGTTHAEKSWRFTTQAAASSLVTAQASYPTLYIATDFDPQFATRARCATVSACNDAIMNALHTAAVFYETQLGYTLAVARQFGPTTLGSETAPSAILDRAQQLSLQPRIQFVHTGSHTIDNQVDLFTFFTGRTMDDKTIGIAFVGTACRNDRSEFGQLVVQHVSNSLNPVIAAHEMGHTLNATHTSSGIMRPHLSNNPPRSFSSSSLLEISSHLDTWYSECRQGMSQGYASPTATPTPRSGSGGSTSPNPYAGKPVTLGLSVSSPLPKTVALTATVSAVNPNCSVSIRSGTTSLATRNGAVLVQFTPTETATTKTGSARFRVKPSGAHNSNVYFVAAYTCTDGATLEVSRVQRFNPNRIRGISSSQRSKRIWLNSLRQSIR